MINIIAAIVLGFTGAILGFKLPIVAQKISICKCSKKSMEFVSDRRYMAPFLRCLVCILNTGIWTFAGLKIDNILASLFLSILFTVAILITIIDMKIKIIPNELVLVMFMIGIGFQILHFGAESLLPACFSMIAMMIFFTAVAGIVGFDKVGAGDIKLAGAMGLALGYPGIITALMIMSAVLLIYSLMGLISKKITLKSMIPFAPFLMSGMAFALAKIVFK